MELTKIKTLIRSIFKKEQVEKHDFKEVETTHIEKHSIAPYKLQNNEIKIDKNNKKELLNKYAEEYLKTYKALANYKYKNLLKTNPEALRLYNKEDVQIMYVNYNKKFYNYHEYIFLVYKPKANMEIKLLDLTDESFY